MGEMGVSITQLTTDHSDRVPRNKESSTTMALTAAGFTNLGQRTRDRIDECRLSIVSRRWGRGHARRCTVNIPVPNVDMLLLLLLALAILVRHGP